MSDDKTTQLVEALQVIDTCLTDVLTNPTTTTVNRAKGKLITTARKLELSGFEIDEVEVFDSYIELFNRLLTYPYLIDSAVNRLGFHIERWINRLRIKRLTS